MRAPWAEPGTVAAPVSIVDLAPTVLDLVGDRVDVLPVPTDGLSLRPWLGDTARGEAERTGAASRPSTWRFRPGSGSGPEFAFFEHADGTIELYDVAGAIGVADFASYATGRRSTIPRRRVGAPPGTLGARSRPASAGGSLTLHCASHRRAPNPPCQPGRPTRQQIVAAAPSRRWSWCCSSRSCGSSGRKAGRPSRQGTRSPRRRQRERRRRGRQRERPRRRTDRRRGRPVRTRSST